MRVEVQGSPTTWRLLGILFIIVAIVFGIVIHVATLPKEPYTEIAIGIATKTIKISNTSKSSEVVYTVDGVEYVHAVQSTEEPIKDGQQFPIHYDPSNPEDSVVILKHNVYVLFKFLYPIVFGSVGIFMLSRRHFW